MKKLCTDITYVKVKNERVIKAIANNFLFIDYYNNKRREEGLGFFASRVILKYETIAQKFHLQNE